MSLDIKSNVSLAPFTTFGIGGPADEFCKAESTQDIIDAVTYAQEKQLPFFILGSGANILIGDKGFRGLVIKNEAKHHSFRHPGEATTSIGSRTDSIVPSELQNDIVLLTAESGITIKELIDICLEKGLSGLEHFAGIPSTLGGALWQNLHFLSPDREQTVFIGEIVSEAELLQISNTKYQISKVDREYFKFGYDYSILHDTKDLVLSATLQLHKEDPQIIQQRIEANLAWRKEKHPENAVHCSAGSVFKKNPAGGAGRFIQQVGLKGYRIGGAQISEKHANFIVNTGGATAADVRGLIELVQQKVKNELGLDLQTEISFIGEF